MLKLTNAILKQLHQPLPGSHKGQNGVLYVAAGSKQYHGSLQYAVEAASSFVDLIYVETDSSNFGVVRALKTVHPSIIQVSAQQRARYLQRSDCLLLGPGLGRTLSAKRISRTLLAHRYRPQHTVIDADALHFMRLSDLTAGTIITPHPGEYRIVFGRVTPLQLSLRIPAVIVAKGDRAQICQNGKCQYNISGIARFTKGGIGDVLAGLTAAFATTNAPYHAACAASLLLSRTAQQLCAHYGANFSSQKLAEQLPLTLKTYSTRRF